MMSMINIIKQFVNKHDSIDKIDISYIRSSNSCKLVIWDDKQPSPYITFVDAECFEQNEEKELNLMLKEIEDHYYS